MCMPLTCMRVYIFMVLRVLIFLYVFQGRIRAIIFMYAQGSVLYPVDKSIIIKLDR